MSEEGLDKKSISDSIKRRERHNHSYMESWAYFVLTKMCCCFKDTGCFKRRAERDTFYQEAMKRLSVETDIVQMIEQLRLSQFLTRL